MTFDVSHLRPPSWVATEVGEHVEKLAAADGNFPPAREVVGVELDARPLSSKVAASSIRIESTGVNFAVRLTPATPAVSP